MQHICRVCKELKEILPSRARHSDWICSPCKSERYYAPRLSRPPRPRGTWSAEAKVSQNRKQYLRRLSDPEAMARMLARKKIRTLVELRKIVRQPCEVCGAQPAEAHHDDYRRPLDVRWLCAEHHREHHRRIGWHKTSPATTNTPEAR